MPSPAPAASRPRAGPVRRGSATTLATRWSSWASSRASVSSDSLRPPAMKNFTPLSGKGLWEAEIMAAGRPSAADSQATPGVGSTPTSTTSAPSVARPADRAACSRGPEMRVSRPTRNGPSPRTRAAARPRARTNSGVSSALAMPRTPSVPNRSVTGRLLALALGVLGCLPGLLQAVLLAFLLAGVSGQEPGPLEGAPQLLVDVHQATGDAQAKGAGLPG